MSENNSHKIKYLTETHKLILMAYIHIIRYSNIKSSILENLHHHATSSRDKNHPSLINSIA